MSLKVCDPASGSGHFMLAAARRIGRELARVRSGEAEPNPEDYRRAVRDVIRRCIYAVDKNPLAVDLCKVALWIEGHASGLPLSFLDNHVKCGDSLVGVLDLGVLEAGIPDDAYTAVTGDDKKVASAIKKENKAEAKGASLFRHNVKGDIDQIAGAFAAVADLPETTPDEVHAKEARYAELRRGSRVAAGEMGLRSLDRGLLRAADRGRQGGRADHPERLGRSCRPPAAGSRRRARRGSRRRAALLPLAAGVPGGLRPRRLRRDARQSAVGADQAPGAGVLRNARSEIAKARTRPRATTDQGAMRGRRAGERPLATHGREQSTVPECERIRPRERPLSRSRHRRSQHLRDLRGDVSAATRDSGRAGFIVPTGIATDDTHQSTLRHLMIEVD